MFEVQINFSPQSAHPPPHGIKKLISLFVSSYTLPACPSYDIVKMKEQVWRISGTTLTGNTEVVGVDMPGCQDQTRLLHS